MKGGKKRGPQTDLPIVHDCCGVDVSDPIGNHTVNFTFKVTAKDDPEKSFDGDIDLILPHNLGKNQKPPKIEITKPETHWEAQLPVLIDDGFINIIKERRLVYKVTFFYKATSHGRGPTRASKKGQDKAPVSVTNHTFFVDASVMLIRGGEFKPVLVYSATCKPPGFQEFTVTVEIDHPILSDAQIRRFEPFACLLKGMHQLPESSESEKYIDPYIVAKNESNSWTTIPCKCERDMKLNCALVFWGAIIPNSILGIELHDREAEAPDIANPLGSGFISPIEPKRSARADALSIETILGVKEESVASPYGMVNLTLIPGRHMKSVGPVAPKESLVHPAMYFACGTYISVEMEDMSKYIQGQPECAVMAKRQTAKETPRMVVEERIVRHFKRMICCTDRDNCNAECQTYMDGLQELIVAINGKAMNVKDISAVPAMKIDQEDSEAVSGFIFRGGPVDLYVLEVLDETDGEQELKQYFSRAPQCEYHRVIVDFTRNYDTRLYHRFDCAVKKFKLTSTFDEILRDPNVYMKASPLTACYQVLNQLNGLRFISSCEEADKDELWPNSQDIELLNAKRGEPLAMEELSFPPRTKQEKRTQNSMKLTPNVVLSEPIQDESKPEQQLEYVEIEDGNSKKDLRGVDFYIARNKEYLKHLSEKCRNARGLVNISEDGETEIWDTRLGKLDNSEEWVIERTEPYKPLAEAVLYDRHIKLQGEKNTGHVPNRKKFYSYSSPKSTMEPIEQLKVNGNNEPWTNGDNSLASIDSKWFKDARGPIRSTFTTAGKPPEWKEIKPLTVQEKWEPVDKRQPDDCWTTGVKHQKRFSSVQPAAKKYDELSKTGVALPPLTIQEKYSECRVFQKDDFQPMKGKGRFNTRFPTKPRKGDTDNPVVRKG